MSGRLAVHDHGSELTATTAPVGWKALVVVAAAWLLLQSWPLSLITPLSALRFDSWLLSLLIIIAGLLARHGHKWALWVGGVASLLAGAVVALRSWEIFLLGEAIEVAVVPTVGMGAAHAVAFLAVGVFTFTASPRRDHDLEEGTTGRVIGALGWVAIVYAVVVPVVGTVIRHFVIPPRF